MMKFNVVYIFCLGKMVIRMVKVVMIYRKDEENGILY